MKKAEVAVVCITYNHKDYIKDAIESFLKQKIEFNYHIYIHDDASDDGTGDIVRELAAMYPEKITAIIQRENLYKKNRNTMMGTCASIKENVRGDYFALCEGDDFWLDPNKLQMQVTYMEEHPDCMMTAHNAIQYNEVSGKITVMSPYDSEQDISVEETLTWKNGNIPTASIVLRPEVYLREGIFLNSCASGDWVIQLLSLTKGKIHYFNQIMSCYRANAKGSYTVTRWADIKKRIPIRVSQMLFLITYDSYTQKRHHDIIKSKMYDILNQLLYDTRNLSPEEVDTIFQTVDYFHQDMTDVQHEKYKMHITEIRDLVMLYREETYLPLKVRDAVKNSSKVFIYGAGYYGEKVLHMILHSEITVTGILVSAGQKCRELFQGIPIYELDEVADSIDGSCILIGVANETAGIIRQNLTNFQNMTIVQPYGLELDEKEE